MGKVKIIGIGWEVEGQCSDGIVFFFCLVVSEMCIDNCCLYMGIVYDLLDIKVVECWIIELNWVLEEKVVQ